MQSWRDLAQAFGNHKGLHVTAVRFPKAQPGDRAHVLFRGGTALREDDPIRQILDEPAAAAARKRGLSERGTSPAESADRWIVHALEHPEVRAQSALHKTRIFEISEYLCDVYDRVELPAVGSSGHAEAEGRENMVESNVEAIAARRKSAVLPILKRLKLTPNTWARRASFNKSVTYGYLNGHSFPQSVAAKALAAVLGIPELPK